MSHLSKLTISPVYKTLLTSSHKYIIKKYNSLQIEMQAHT